MNPEPSGTGEKQPEPAHLRKLIERIIESLVAIWNANPNLDWAKIRDRASRALAPVWDDPSCLDLIARLSSIDLIDVRQLIKISGTVTDSVIKAKMRSDRDRDDEIERKYEKRREDVRARVEGTKEVTGSGKGKERMNRGAETDDPKDAGGESTPHLDPIRGPSMDAVRVANRPSERARGAWIGYHIDVIDHFNEVEYGSSFTCEVASLRLGGAQAPPSLAAAVDTAESRWIRLFDEYLRNNQKHSNCHLLAYLQDRNSGAGDVNKYINTEEGWQTPLADAVILLRKRCPSVFAEGKITDQVIEAIRQFYDTEARTILSPSYEKFCTLLTSIAPLVDKWKRRLIAEQAKRNRRELLTTTIEWLATIWGEAPGITWEQLVDHAANENVYDNNDRACRVLFANLYKRNPKDSASLRVSAAVVVAAVIKELDDPVSSS
ncbi:hypothetical protein [Amycolatopsis sp. H20-H5]|uniref:hypothetical protein n=1 Tax=Amycolatopsis sp. H20-H5 TaxID=3046309 RepID=UPI002DB7CBAB|nr:hypothetical protein [Amycolatopsis sp. H20-H5]MEC3975633.1 hypothetical protein [Amycolatopsis sp. H20-H5]